MTNAEEILAAVTDGMTFALGAYEVTLNNPVAAGNMFSADLVVTLGGVVVFDDDARVINPLLLVPDDAGDIVEPGHTEINEITGEEETAPDKRYRYDPLGAIKVTITETILVLIK